jgi:hypothetical protein
MTNYCLFLDSSRKLTAARALDVKACFFEA